MHLVIVTSGSRGDVQPYLALALRAVAAGHRVTVATHEGFRPWIESLGLPFRTIHGDPAGMLGNPGARAWLADGSYGGLWQFVKEFRRDFPGLFEGLLADLMVATADADFVFYGSVCMAAAQLHEARGMPVMGGFLAPLTRTGEFPPVGVAFARANSERDRRRNRISHQVGDQLLWLPSRGIVNRWRRDTLRLPPLPWSGPFARQRSAEYPIAYGFSHALLPRPRDWPAWIEATGWWYLDSPGYTPPAALQAFLDAGDPPVTIGFGSMTPQDSEWLTGIITQACERAGCRALLLQGWGTLGAQALPSWMHVERDVPHHWLLPRCSANVHHGGAGTTGASVRSGKPSLAIPLGFDQQFWGSLLQHAGVAPAPIRRRELTVNALAAALRTMQTDMRMRDAAAALGEAIAREDGTGAALARIEAHARR